MVWTIRLAFDEAVSSLSEEGLRAAATQIETMNNFIGYWGVAAPVCGFILALLTPGVIVRSWYARKNGPGAHYYDQVLCEAHGDLKKTLQQAQSRLRAQQEAETLQTGTPPSHGIGRSRRL